MKFSAHPAAAALAALGVNAVPKEQAPAKPAAKPHSDLYDAAEMGGAGDFALTDIRVQAAASIQEWVATPDSDLDEGETKADRLFALLVGIADANKDGEISEDEQAVIDIAVNAAYDYLTAKGVTDEDATALLQDGDGDAAARVSDLLSAEMVEGEGALDDIDAFVFDSDAQASVFDSVNDIMDAVYKKAVAVRKGKKVRINKRVSGRVQLSAAQKVAIAKARLKSGSASAMMHRMKSMKVRKNMGL